MQPTNPVCYRWLSVDRRCGISSIVLSLLVATVIATAGCSADAPSQPTATAAPRPTTPGFNVELPRVGDTRQTANGELHQYEFAPMGEGYYDIEAGGQPIRLILLYAKLHDGSQRVMQVNFNSHEPMTRDERDAILKYALHSAKAARWRDASPSLADDPVGLKNKESMGLFRDQQLAKALSTDWYYQHPPGTWKHERCPDAPAGALELYKEAENDGGISEIGVFSAYLDHCQYKIII